MLAPLVNTVRESIRYRGKEGHWSWVLHRVTGLGLVLFMILHIFGMGMIAFNPPLHDAMIELYKTPLFSIGELALAFSLVFHAINGTRIAILELKPELWNQQQKLTRLSLIITLAISVPMLSIMAYKSISHFLTHGF
jgi:succinate dehydrogenase / fumarate reductase, cytochrome b subunit